MVETGASSLAAAAAQPPPRSPLQQRALDLLALLAAEAPGLAPEAWRLEVDRIYSREVYYSQEGRTSRSKRPRGDEDAEPCDLIGRWVGVPKTFFNMQASGRFLGRVTRRRGASDSWWMHCPSGGQEVFASERQVRTWLISDEEAYFPVL